MRGESSSVSLVGEHNHSDKPLSTELSAEGNVTQEEGDGNDLEIRSSLRRQTKVKTERPENLSLVGGSTIGNDQHGSKNRQFVSKGSTKFDFLRKDSMKRWKYGKYGHIKKHCKKERPSVETEDGQHRRINETQEQQTSPHSLQPYALDKAPPPIKTRRDTGVRESSPPDLSPPPSPKRMRELVQKEDNNSLAFGNILPSKLSELKSHLSS